MEQLNDLFFMLEQLDCPAFLVSDGKICAVNAGAKQRFAQPGAVIEDLLVTGYEEYCALTDGSLYATVVLEGTAYPCTITKLHDQDLFTLENDSAGDQLQALALAAGQLRIPVSELSLELNRLQASDEAMMAMINKTIHKLQRIIGNMSDAGRYVGRVPSKTTQELCALFQSVLEKAQVLLAQSGIQLHYTLPKEPVYSNADSEMLTRAVYNMLSNACKYATAQTVVTASVKTNNKKLYVTVQDNGNGIPRELRSNIFHRYRREPGIEDPRYGLGLGMSLIHAAATAHGGTVLVEQPEGQGARITMSIALEKSNTTLVRSSLFKTDIYGGQDQALIELSDILPPNLYNKNKY